MSKPAAVIGCYHTCPQYDGDRAHVGGPVVSGSTDVFLEGKMACRQGDRLQCNSPNPDFVRSGSKTVFINGHSAARQNDPSAHGGCITEGSFTIFIA